MEPYVLDDVSLSAGSPLRLGLYMSQQDNKYPTPIVGLSSIFKCVTVTRSSGISTTNDRNKRRLLA